MQQVFSFAPDVAENLVDRAREVFFETQSGQFSSWWNERFSDDDRRAYLLISGSKVGATVANLSALLDGTGALAATSSLCAYGVVRRYRESGYKANGSMFKQWVASNVSSTAAAAGAYDRGIYEKLLHLDPEIAKKYLSSWAIQSVVLDNYSGAVSEMPDVLTLTMHRLAPDAEVMADRAYVQDIGEDGLPLKKPSRRRKVEFIVRRRTALSCAKLEQELELFETLAQQLGGSAVRGYGEASAKTHKTAAKDDAWRCLKQLESVLAQVL